MWFHPWDSCAHFTRRENKKGSRSCPFPGTAVSSGRFCRGLGLLRVFLAEFLHTAGGVHDLLLAGVERMAIGAHLDMQRLAHGRVGLPSIAAAAGNLDFVIVGVDVCFHGFSFGAVRE